MFKDLSELYLLDPNGFTTKVESLIQAARPMSEIRQEALSAEARECLASARNLLSDPNLLDRLDGVLHDLGYAGDTRPAMMSYVALTSRLLEAPMNQAYISQSAAGKNAAAEAPLPLFPEEAYYLIRASSPRALVYNEAEFTHRIVIVTEADSLAEDGPAASAIRSIMSDREMSYEVVEKGKDGTFRVRKIIKPGPTGLITTSTRSLGEQASTRTLTISIPDSAEQTKLVLHAQADRANLEMTTPDLEPWVALQRWLELAGERRVVIPYAHALADAFPHTAVRMRRDFPQLLTVIQAIAVLHQRLRERDEIGRIVATINDYAEARRLLEDVFTTTVGEGITSAIRETVEAVTSLSKDGAPVTEQQLVGELELAKSTIHYRVQRAIRGGWLVNETTQKRAPARLTIGTPLPEGCPLPPPDDLLVRAEHLQNHSNHSNSSFGSATEQKQTIDSNPPSNRFEPGSKNGSNPNRSWTDGGFEGFESFSEESAHTEGDGRGIQEDRSGDSAEGPGWWEAEI